MDKHDRCLDCSNTTRLGIAYSFPLDFRQAIPGPWTLPYRINKKCRKDTDLRLHNVPCDSIVVGTMRRIEFTTSSLLAPLLCMPITLHSRSSGIWIGFAMGWGNWLRMYFNAGESPFHIQNITTPTAFYAAAALAGHRRPCLVNDRTVRSGYAAAHTTKSVRGAWSIWSRHVR